MNPRFGCYAVYEADEEGWENWQHQFSQVNSCLSEAGAQIVTAPEAVKDEASAHRVAAYFREQKVDLLHPLVITWSFDHYSTLIQKTCAIPMAIRTIPGIRTGSVVGGQQLGSVLYDLEIEHRLFYGAPDDIAIARETLYYGKACAVLRRMKNSVFTMLGRRTPGMTPIAIDELELMRLLGIRIMHLGMDEFEQMVNQVSTDTGEALWKELSQQSVGTSSSKEHGISAMKYFLALKKLVIEEGLSGITIGSYPACQGTACLPIAMLNNEGIPAGCEGDMNSTIVMFMLQMLSDNPVHFGEMLDIDQEKNEIVTSHCGAAAPALADQNGFVLCPVRLAHDGVCIRYTARPGPVTYVNMVGRRDTYRLCAFEGQAIPTEMVFEGNPMRIRLKTPFKDIWQVIDKYGFGHHWMTGYSHMVPVISEFCRMSGIKGVFPDLSTVR